ncbi:MAG TPA: FAD-dependent oxidoreductase [Solirubrobacterales bacterium]|nr:FAD-dependent oxidoreductase [Solirubrobacterales bacterium]
MPRAELPDSARCVVIGGGVGGTSLAYHLAKLGWEDVVLLERSQLTSGSTFHSAGLVGQLRGSVSLTKMMMHSVELYRRLGEESEFDPGWVECGGIRLASSEERMEELRRQAGWAKTFGLPLELISAAEAKEMFPLMSTEGVLGAAWLPTDGYIDPAQLTYALADGARQGGCRIFTETRVTGIEVDDGRVRGVQTERGDVAADVVVDAGGMYAAEIARLAGIRVPLIPMSHQYLVTQPHDEVREARQNQKVRRTFAPDSGQKDRHTRGHLPTLRDPDLLVYYREDGDGLVMGGYERRSEPAFLPQGTGRVEAIPADFNGRLLEEDWERFEEITENSKRRVPAMDRITVTKLINGPEAFTPDNEFCLGETEVSGFFVCAGFCAHGLAGAGGIGKVVAEWIAEGEPSLDLWHMDIRRFGAQYRSPAYTHARIKETYETYYDIRYPNHERQAGRPLRVSPANAWHREHEAAFGEKSGWERVNWYGRNAAAGDEGLRPRGWAGRHWSPAIGAEHRATREAVALFDESSFAKLEIEGPGAESFLEVLCDNRVGRGVGQITYTQMLNHRGGIECDFTVTRLAEDRFSIVTGTAFGNHDREWMRRHLPDDGEVRIHDVTSGWACFGIWGPRAREVLQPLTPQDLGDEAFPYMTVRETTVGNVPVRMLRVTYVGELGWEVYCPTEYGLGLWRALWEAGRPHGIVAGGYRAIDSLRLEKGYRVWGADVTPDEDPYEGGVGFCVKLDKGNFNGRDALLEAKERGPRSRLRCLTLADPRSIALGNEPVRVGGEIAGRVTTGGYGYTVGRSIAYAYLPPEHEPGTAVEVEIFGRWVEGEVASEPLFDPKGERIRA